MDRADADLFNIIAGICKSIVDQVGRIQDERKCPGWSVSLAMDVKQVSKGERPLISLCNAGLLFCVLRTIHMLVYRSASTVGNCTDVRDFFEMTGRKYESSCDHRINSPRNQDAKDLEVAVIFFVDEQLWLMSRSRFPC